MRRIGSILLVAGVLSAGAVSSASAQDVLYSPRSAAYWTGFYVGGNIGYGWSRLTTTATGAGVAATGSEHLNGILGGAQAGLNVQMNNWVLGVESDFQLTDQSRTSIAAGGGTTVTETDKLPWFGTTRVRAGVPYGQFLIYATGGLAYGEFKANATLTGTVAGTYQYSTTRFGWVVGGGLEAYMARNWTWKVDYLHIESGTITNTFVVGGVPVITNSKLTNDVVRFGVNYLFR